MHFEKRLNKCPLCGSAKRKPLNSSRDYLSKCRICGIMFNSAYEACSYNIDYFNDLYKAQYSKTYFEDFENIYRISLRRIDKINNLMLTKKNISEASLLDIGSALGFFLKACRDYGINNINGIEISGYAVNYCKKEFNIDVMESSFEDAKIEDSYDIITGWYFLEHCFDPTAVLKRIYDLLKPDGIFAFSVPSFFGPQYMFNKNTWIKNHPNDHRIDFSPSTVKHFLRENGFRQARIYPAAIHPERIVHQKSIFYDPFAVFYSVISKILSFSDTIEVYAVK